MSLPARARRLSGPLGAAGRLATRRSPLGGGVVLAYHDVVAGSAVDGPWSVTAAQLRTHLDVVRRLGFRFAPLSELTGRALRGESVDGLAAVVFDDALAGVARHALPILHELEVPSTLMTVSTAWGAPPAWWPGSAPTMTRAELVEAVAHGVDLAAHTRTHQSLAALADRGPSAAGELRDEVAGCRDQLENITGSPVDLFAYPFGHHTPAVREAVEEAGYTAAFTFLNGRVEPGLDALRLPRLTMGAHQSGPRLAYHLARAADSWPDHQLDRVSGDAADETGGGGVVSPGFSAAPVATGLTCEVIDDLAAAESLAPEWDALADAIGAGPLVRSAYCLSWWRGMGPGRLQVATVRDGDRLVALAPLHARRVGPVEVLRWLGHGLGTVSEALVLPEREDAARLLWERVAGPRRVLDLVESRAAAPALAPLVALDRQRRRTTVEPRDACPVIDLEGDGLEHVRRPGSKNLRKVLKRADAALADAGRTFSVEVALDVDLFDKLLPDIRTAFDVAEAAKPRQHLLEPPYEAFVLPYLREEIARGQAVALVGYLDDQPITFLLAMITPVTSTLSLWISRYVPDSEQFSPGHLLLRSTFQWAAGHGLTRVDQLLGVSQTKRQWSSDTYETVDVRHGSASSIALLDGATRAAEKVGDLRARVRP